MTTRDKLLNLAARMDQLRRELLALAGPVNEGGAPDISFPASHVLGTAELMMGEASRRLMRVAAELPKTKEGGTNGVEAAPVETKA